MPTEHLNGRINSKVSNDIKPSTYKEAESIKKINVSNDKHVNLGLEHIFNEESYITSSKGDENNQDKLYFKERRTNKKYRKRWF